MVNKTVDQNQQIRYPTIIMDFPIQLLIDIFILFAETNPVDMLKLKLDHYPLEYLGEHEEKFYIGLKPYTCCEEWIMWQVLLSMTVSGACVYSLGGGEGKKVDGE